MKKLLLLLMMSVFSVNFLFADPVDAGFAMNIAKKFYVQSIENKGFTDVNLTLAYTEKSLQASSVKNSDVREFPLFYLFSVNQSDGFVIVSADNDVTPVLGYATSGSFSINNLPPAFRKLLEKYKEEILYVITNNLKADDEISAKWETLENGKPLNPAKNTKSVNPLMQTTWNQNPYENEMCPADPNGPGGHCLTGCPATAMAQIMKYWNYPATGTGFHSYNSNYGTLSADFGSTTYDYASMPDHLNGSNNATALLMFHCGVAVEMTYGPDGSYGWVIANDNQGAHPACCENAYKTYFGYSAAMVGSIRATHSDAEWKEMLKTDLNAGRPVQYAGFGPGGGHTWVCDGFDNSDYFHMNWGWGGAGDGFYSIDALNPGTNSFNSNQQALFGIQPNQSSNTTLQIYSTVTVTPSPIAFGQQFSVNADILNTGSTTFNGDYTAALFNDQGTFIDYIQTFTGESLPPNNHYIGGLTFATTGIAGATPGNYTIGIYSRPTGGGWTLVGAGSYTNPVNVTVEGTANDIKLHSSILLNQNPILVNQPFTATTDIANYGSTDFTGDISLDLHSSDGSWIQVIQEYTNVSLPAGNFFNDVTFSSTGLGVDPGSYYLVVWDKPTGGDWTIVAGGSYTNPIEVIISSQPIAADSYEANNQEGTASTLQLSFLGNSANVNSAGSNIHSGTDVDYYRVDFPAGYSYTLNARVHDSYNSGNGQLYTGDVMFSYKSGTAWSDWYDHVMPANIFLQNGGTLIFNVTPYFAGTVGTYLFDMNVTRTGVGIDHIGENSRMLVFPNPARDVVTFQLELLQPEFITGALNNMYGQKVLEIANGNYSAGQQNISIDVSLLAPGYYTYQIKTKAGEATGKLVITR